MAEKFRVTLGYMSEYIKYVGDSAVLVFINSFDFTHQHKNVLRHFGIGKKGQRERRSKSEVRI